MKNLFSGLSRTAPQLLGAVLLSGIAACSSTTTLDVDNTQEFPKPLVEAVPVHMGIYIPEEFQNYVFEEYERAPSKVKKKKTQGPFKEDDSTTADKEEKQQSKDADGKDKRLKMRVSLGDAQTRMLKAVVPPVFREWTMLESTEPSSMPAGMELYLVPSISKLQYTTPKSSRAKVYEIWLQYIFNVYDRNGDLVTNWVVPSYGKTPSAFMKSERDALNAATQMALRDCGAAFSTGFSKEPAINRWLRSRGKLGAGPIPQENNQ